MTKMNHERIFYFCPDFDSPSAGIKRLYRHVYHLNRYGFKAFIVHSKKDFVLTWHGYEVPVLCLERNLSLNERDILVFPEGMTGLMKRAKDLPCTKVVIALNWAYVYQALPLGINWKDYRIHRVMTPSRVIKEFVEWSMGVTVDMIENYIDITLFSYNHDRKKDQICYMARKSSSGSILHSIFNRRDSIVPKYEWVALENMDEDEYAETLVESKIFLATSLEEGVPTSVLEAMACGCIVVGYSGVGGADYMVGSGKKQNCFLVENGNIPRLGRALEQVMFTGEGLVERRNRVIKNALVTSRQFSDEKREAVSLKEYFLRLQ